MKRSRGRLALVAAAGWLAVPALHAQETGITREGGYWVQTVNGSGTLGPSARFRVMANGDVTVRGGAQSGFSYTVRLRLKARNEREARNRLEALKVTSSQRGDYYVLSVPRGGGTADLKVSVPRGLPDLTVTTMEGGVDVADLAGSVRLETGGGGVRCDRVGGNVVTSTAGGGIWLGTIDGMAHCVTAGGSIHAALIRGEAIFETGGGDIIAQEVGGLVRASTAGGGIKIARAGSAVVAATAGGPIEVGRATGKVTAKTSGGPIQVDWASSVHCESAAGGIRLRNVSGSLRASTAVGSISAQLLSGQPFGDSFLTTGSGDITVFIPSNLGVTIHAENQSADSLRRIVTDFSSVAVKLLGSAVVADGPINGGGPMLRIASTGGTIFIRKQ